ncbi:MULTISPECIES: VENN motif pre-toxin domain-containing protein [unclassified Gilliamella]|uniref:VENN motif pre-toxin domain-containing protein n=1 Tax=unclassified Gilliamella TaxID=2685620 RepID=UPI001328F9F8|nr:MULTISPECIES: VENN motif pre-toxin domain-containing protein [unclassified Gilliamella]MWN32941.1 hypothetical protein [Gilliamella sp. Pra-s60]MWP30389.1 hypothetical protein [Gilliamella sp. Pra-s54]
MNQGMSAMGSSTRQGIDMAVSIINGLISGDMTGAAAGALAPKSATIIKQQTEGNTVANTVSHAILGAVVAELQGNSALAGGLSAAASERGAEVIAGILYPDKDIKDLSQEERQQISALSQLATGLAIAAAGGDIQDVNTGVAAGKNAVENNSLLGDWFREKHKNSAEYWKTEIREKIGENTVSQILNGILISYGDTVDFGAAVADTGLDAILALGSCTVGVSYCDTALDDLKKTNKTASDAMISLINGDTWDHVRDVFAKAQKGDQRSLEEVASILTSVLAPSKLAGNTGKVVNKIDDIVPPKAGKGGIVSIILVLR